MENQSVNEKGFTLIEIITSISIIVLVLLVFLPLFPQTASWTKSAESELVSGNLLGRVAGDVRANPAALNLDEIEPGDTITVRTSELGLPEYNQPVNLTLSLDAETGLYLVYIETINKNDKTDAASFVYVDGGDS